MHHPSQMGSALSRVIVKKSPRSGAFVPFKNSPGKEYRIPVASATSTAKHRALAGQPRHTFSTSKCSLRFWFTHEPHLLSKLGFSAVPLLLSDSDIAADLPNPVRRRARFNGKVSNSQLG